MKILCINCKPDLSYFTSRGLNLEVEYQTLNKVFPLKHFYNQLYTPDVEQYLEDTYKSFKYSVIIFGWNPKDYTSILDSTGGVTGSDPLSNGTFWCTVREDVNPVNYYVIHELHHALVGILNVNFGYNKNIKTQVRDWMDKDSQGRVYYLNSQPENPLSNYAQTWEQIKPHLQELNSIKYMNTYKYFKPSEIVALKPELVEMLDKAREIAGIPFKITSGYRTIAQNQAVGGVNDSSHESGLAVDLLVSDGISGAKILLSLTQVGFKRFGFYGDGHIHVDIDRTKPYPCYWVK